MLLLRRDSVRSDLRQPPFRFFIAEPGPEGPVSFEQRFRIAGCGFGELPR